MKRAWFCAITALPVAIVSRAHGADPPSAQAEPLAQPAAVAADKAGASTVRPGRPPLMTPAPYSLAWQLRPAAAVNVMRSDTSTGFRTVKDGGGTTLVTLLLASYKITPDVALMIRGGYVDGFVRVSRW